jgi:hypothetical protein
MSDVIYDAAMTEVEYSDVPRVKPERVSVPVVPSRPAPTFSGDGSDASTGDQLDLPEPDTRDPRVQRLDHAIALAMDDPDKLGDLLTARWNIVNEGADR